MARQTKRERLTKESIAQIRSTAARSVPQLLTRLRKCASGEIEMTANQIKAATVVISNVLPAQASTQIEDITPERKTKEQVESAYKAAITEMLRSMTPEEIEAYRDGKNALQ